MRSAKLEICQHVTISVPCWSKVRVNWVDIHIIKVTIPIASLLIGIWNPESQTNSVCDLRSGMMEFTCHVNFTIRMLSESIFLVVSKKSIVNNADLIRRLSTSVFCPTMCSCRQPLMEPLELDMSRVNEVWQLQRNYVIMVSGAMSLCIIYRSFVASNKSVLTGHHYLDARTSTVLYQWMPLMMMRPFVWFYTMLTIFFKILIDH